MFRLLKTLIGIILTIIEFLLIMRFVLRFFDANPRTPFAAWIYGHSAALVQPFHGIFPTWGIGSFVLDLTTLAALIVYVLVGQLILEIL